MTRINANIHPSKLVDKHLFAEYREMPRVASQLQKRINSGKGMPKITEQLKLGSGHQSFFLDKGLFLRNRYKELYLELINRGYKLKLVFDWDTFYKDKQEYFNDYEMSDFENQLLAQRLSEKLHTMSNIKYRGSAISTEEAIKMLSDK